MLEDNDLEVDNNWLELDQELTEAYKEMKEVGSSSQGVDVSDSRIFVGLGYLSAESNRSALTEEIINFRAKA